MAKKILTSTERRDICRQHRCWPEVHIANVEDTGGLVWLHLTCGHVTPRRRRVAKMATIVCEQCAAKSTERAGELGKDGQSWRRDDGPGIGGRVTRSTAS